MHGASGPTQDAGQRLLSEPRPIPLREVLVAERDHNLTELPTGRGAGGRTQDAGQRLSHPRPITLREVVVAERDHNLTQTSAAAARLTQPSVTGG